MAKVSDKKNSAFTLTKDPFAIVSKKKFFGMLFR